MTPDPRGPGGGTGGGELERVRACGACGEIVSFEERTCPSCGHHEPIVVFTTLSGDERPCRVCDEPLPVEGLFCGACGAEQDPAPRVEAEAPAGPVSEGRSLDLTAVALTLLGPLVLLAAVLAAYLYV